MIHVQEPLITAIIEERTMGRGRKKELGPCGDGEKYRDVNGEIRTWHATKKPLGRPASKKTLATGVVDVASPVHLSPVPVLPNAICIDMDRLRMCKRRSQSRSARSSVLVRSILRFGQIGWRRGWTASQVSRSSRPGPLE